MAYRVLRLESQLYDLLDAVSHHLERLGQSISARVGTGHGADLQSRSASLLSPENG